MGISCQSSKHLLWSQNKIDFLEMELDRVIILEKNSTRMIL